LFSFCSCIILLTLFTSFFEPLNTFTIVIFSFCLVELLLDLIQGQLLLACFSL
jgi:hypothetical protein